MIRNDRKSSQFIVDEDADDADVITSRDKANAADEQDIAEEQDDSYEEVVSNGHWCPTPTNISYTFLFKLRRIETTKSSEAPSTHTRLKDG